MWKQALILGIGLSVLAGPALADRRDHRHEGYDRHGRYDRHDYRDRGDRHRHGRYDGHDKYRWARGYRGYSWWTPRWGHHQYYRHHGPGHHGCR